MGAAHLKTILIVIGPDGAGAGIGAGGGGGVAARGSGGVASWANDGVTVRGGRRRRAAGAAGAAPSSSIAGAAAVSSAAAVVVAVTVAFLAGVGLASIDLSSALRQLLACGCNTWLSWPSPKNDAPNNWRSCIGALGLAMRGVGGCIECDDGMGGPASNGVVSSTCSQSISVKSKASISGAVSISVSSNATAS